MSGKVFISYVRENHELVQRLCMDLREAGIEVWLDKNELAPGVRWQLAIRRAIDSGTFFLACFSHEYALQGVTYMNEELTLAIEQLRRRPTDRVWFIPIILNHGGEIPDRPIGGGESLRDLQWVSLADDWSAGVKTLIKVIAPTAAESKPQTELEKTIQTSVDTSRFERRPSFHEHYSLVVKYYDGDDKVYLLWNHNTNRLDKMSRSANWGVRWFGPETLSDADNARVKEAISGLMLKKD